MSDDLDAQRERAEAFQEILHDLIDVEFDDETLEAGVTYTVHISADMVLDALGCCGLVLQPGEDAGKAFIDGIIRKVRS